MASIKKVLISDYNKTVDQAKKAKANGNIKEYNKLISESKTIFKLINTI